MFIIYFIDLSTKNKMERRVHIFTKIKNRDGWKQRGKKIFFSVILFQKFLIFLIWAFSENVQCSIVAFL